MFLAVVNFFSNNFGDITCFFAARIFSLRNVGDIGDVGDVHNFTCF